MTQANHALPERGAFGNKRLAPKDRVKSKGEQARAAVCKLEGDVKTAGLPGPRLPFLV